MSEKSTLSLGNNLSTETQTKLQRLASKPSEVIVETPNTNKSLRQNLYNPYKIRRLAV